MGQPTQTKTTIRKTDDANHGPVWRVTFGCGCPRGQFCFFDTARRIAIYHQCPPPWPDPPTARRPAHKHGRWV